MLPDEEPTTDTDGIERYVLEYEGIKTVTLEHQAEPPEFRIIHEAVNGENLRLIVGTAQAKQLYENAKICYDKNFEQWYKQRAQPYIGWKFYQFYLPNLEEM